MKDKLIVTTDQWDQLREGNQMEAINSGIKAIDDIVGGYFKKELTVLCAASGNGKSIISFSSALRMSTMGYRVLYVSLENSISVDANRRVRIMEQYELSDGRFEYLNGDLVDGLIGIKDIEDLVDGEDYDVVFIDSVDFIKEVMEKIDDAFGSFRVLNEVCDKLRKIAGKKGCAIVVTAQLNRGSTSKDLRELGMGDIQGSLGIVQKASHVWAIQKEWWGMKIIKNRTELLGNSDFMYMSVDGVTLDVRIQGRGVGGYGKKSNKCC